MLFKFLDAHDRLSIQVHPDDARAAKLAPPDLGKTEAWVMLACEPGSYLYAGLRRGIDRDTLRREVARQTCELCVERIEPRAGDCFFLPAGVVHALGPGLLVAEIQQASDTTYRLFDWNRRGPDGQSRPLHVEQALESIDFQYGPLRAQRPQSTDRAEAERLVGCDKFILDRVRFCDTRRLGGDDRCHILAVLEGTLEMQGDPAGRPMQRGDVMLLPAELKSVAVHASEQVVLLDAYLP